MICPAHGQTAATCSVCAANLHRTMTPPAPDAELPTMAEAVAAGDGTLHGAIDYWQGKCAALTAEIKRVTAERDSKS